MSGRDIRFGFDGAGRALGPNGAKKVEQAVITKQFALDTLSIQRSRELLRCSPHSFTKYTCEDVFHFKQDELAFYVRGSSQDAVRTSVNGLDAQFSAHYPNDPEMVRALVEEIIVPIGFVEEDVDPAKRIGYVALQVGGSKTTGAPGVYNFAGAGKNPQISPGVGVCFVPPNLVHTHQYGNAANGVPEGKVLLVARAANSQSTSDRILTIVSHINTDPMRFKAAMSKVPKLVETWTRTACAIESALTSSMLLGIYVLLKNNILAVGDAARQSLETRNAPDSRDYAETVTTRMGELLGAIKATRISSELSAAENKEWKRLQFELRQTLFLVPHHKTNKLNARYEFGFKRLMSGENISIGRNAASSKVANNGFGEMLSLQLGYLDNMLQRICQAMYAEREKQLGVAHSTPTNVDTGLFQMFIAPRGGLAEIDC